MGGRNGVESLAGIIWNIQIIKILDHLGLSEEAKPKRKRGPPLPVKNVETITEPYDDGWLEYEEPFIDVQTL
jgi:hypothetical protein